MRKIIQNYENILVLVSKKSFIFCNFSFFFQSFLKIKAKIKCFFVLNSKEKIKSEKETFVSAGKF